MKQKEIEIKTPTELDEQLANLFKELNLKGKEIGDFRQANEHQAFEKGGKVRKEYEDKLHKKMKEYEDGQKKYAELNEKFKARYNKYWNYMENYHLFRDQKNLIEAVTLQVLKQRGLIK